MGKKLDRSERAEFHNRSFSRRISKQFCEAKSFADVSIVRGRAPRLFINCLRRGLTRVMSSREGRGLAGVPGEKSRWRNANKRMRRRRRRREWKIFTTYVRFTDEFLFFLDARKSFPDKSTSGSGADPPGDGWNRAARSALRRFSCGNFSEENTYTVDLPPASRPFPFFLSSFSSFSLSIPFYGWRNFISTRTRPRRHLVASRWKNLSPSVEYKEESFRR